MAGDRVRFEILGPLRVFLGGRPVPITAGKSKVVLAALLLHANEPVTAERLMAYMWEEPPGSARTVLHSVVLRLRRAMGDPGVIRTVGSGYLVRVAPGELDLHDFLALLDRADKARVQEDKATEHDLLTRALGLWRGSPSHEVASPALQRAELVALEELRLHALSRRIELDLAARRHVRLVSELRRLTLEHPFKEGFWGQLMTALHQGGRQAEALAVYQEVRRTLADELGVEPGSELRDLHAAILSADVAAGDPPVPAAPAPAAWPVLCQLPLPAGDFVGREADHASLAGRLAADAAEVVVVWGPPGAGKTALAIRVAHDLRAAYPDGQWYVSLRGDGESAADPGEIIADLLMASGLPSGMIPHGLAARTAAFRARLAGRRVLLVLDNVRDPGQVEALLPGTASNGVLVTSRSAMGELPGAYHHWLGPLPRADAVEMLGRIVGAERVQAERDTAAQIADLCGGLPLALRIVGSRLQPQPALRLGVMAGRLRDEKRRLDELVTGRVTVRAELRVSYRDLGRDAQTAFRGMGLLPAGDFAAWALGVLTGGDGDRMAEHLAKAGLLEPAADDPTGRPRHRPHDLVALYARELAAQDDPAVTRTAMDRLLDVLVSLGSVVHRRTPRFLEGLPADRVEAVAVPREALTEAAEDPTAWVHRERHLLLTAIERACAAGAHAKAGALASLVVPTLAGMGGFPRLRHAMTVLREASFAAGDERVGFRAEYARAALSLTDDLVGATAGFERCAAAFERMNAVTEHAYSLSMLAFARSLQHRYDEESAARAVELADTTGEPALKALALRCHADVLAAGGDPGRACVLYERALEHCRGFDTSAVESDILVRHGRSALALDDLGAALRACERAIALVSGEHQPNGLAWGLSLRSRIRLASGEHEEAIETARRARALMAETDDLRGAATVSLTLAKAYLAANRHEEAVALLQEIIPDLHTSGASLTGSEAGRLLREARSGPD